MNEITKNCPVCAGNDKKVELIYIEWSPFDLGQVVCNECGYKKDYNENREHKK